jgi:3-hydroxybutyryl-CoA dehydrogenase
MNQAIPIQTICICGAGTMGSGIAQVAAMSGFHTIQFDVNTEMLSKSRASITAQLERLVSKSILREAAKESALSRLSFTSEINDCVADLVIEAIIEQKEAKINLFNQLAGINSAHTIFATNTSSITIASIAAGVAHPERMVGLHFFNPAPVMKLVEVIRSPQSNPAVIEALLSFVSRIGKTPVLCNDSPGFIVNRIARPYYLEALHLLANGDISVEAIDALMESAGFKMGPFKLMDLIGIDINFSVSNIVWTALNQPLRLKPSPIQQEKILSGDLGKKTGKGFYVYSHVPK